ncbi:MAG: type II toxin-antitoxin system RelE/ParE family toxin [Propionivibrio sp.]
MLKALRSLFLTAEQPQEESVSFEVRRAKFIRSSLLSAVAAGALAPSETVAAVTAEAATLQSSLVSFGWPNEIDHAFERLQSEDVGFHAYAEEKAEAFRKAYAEGIRFSLRAPDWRFALSDDFIKSIERIDKKLQGRVLEAITRIAQSPTTVVGDTMKPLTADLKGLWRYRVGDYRLVYAPDTEAKHITLLSFETRGDVYS